MTRGNPHCRHEAKPGKGTHRNSYWLYGKHAVSAALANPERKLLRLWLVNTRHPEPKVKDPMLQEILRSSQNDKVEYVDARRFDTILPPDTPHQGIAAEVLPLAAKSLQDIANLRRIMVLDQVTDPHNVGAILRSCAAFGADALVMPKDHSPEEGGALAKAASGALEAVPVVKVTNLVSALKELKAQGVWLLGLDGKAKLHLHDAPGYDKVALVMGAEGAGLRRLTQEHCDLLVSLPISSKVESLNVSNAAAIALYALSAGISKVSK